MVSTHRQLLFGVALAACGSPGHESELPAAPTVVRVASLTASPTASGAPRHVAPEPGDIDPSRAKEPATVWSYPTDGGEPVLSGGLVIVKDPDGESLSAVVPETGKRAWRLAAPAGVSFGEVAAEARDAVYVGGHSPAGGTLSRVEARTGKLAWHVEGPDDLQVGHDGSGGVVAVDGCASKVINLASGRMTTTTLKDTFIRIHPMREDARVVTRCERSNWPLLERSGVTLVSHGKFHNQELLGVNALGATSYSIAVNGAHPRVAFIDGDEVVLLLLGQEVEIMRVHVVSGAVRFRKQLVAAAACEEDKSGYYAEAVRGAKGKGQLFVRACGRAMLLEMGSGALIWGADIGADAAFLSGVVTAPWEPPATVEVSSVKPLAARLFNVRGNVEKTIPLPADTREVMPVGGGVVTTNGGLDVTAFFDEKGRRWRLPLAFGNSFLLGERFMVLGSKVAAQVVIEPHGGSAFVVSGCGSDSCTSGSPYAVGQVGALWLTTRSDPDELFAVRVGP